MGIGRRFFLSLLSFCLFLFGVYQHITHPHGLDGVVFVHGVGFWSLDLLVESGVHPALSCPTIMTYAFFFSGNRHIEQFNSYNVHLYLPRKALPSLLLVLVLYDSSRPTRSLVRRAAVGGQSLASALHSDQ